MCLLGFLMCLMFCLMRVMASLVGFMAWGLLPKLLIHLLQVLVSLRQITVELLCPIRTALLSNFPKLSFQTFCVLDQFVTFSHQIVSMFWVFSLLR